jgi:type III pantothenate kinase
VNITIDSGNSATKIGFFENGRLLKVVCADAPADIPEMLPADKNARVIISSVNTSIELLKNTLREYHKLVILDHTTKVPVRNLYETPHTLGMDRLAAVIGAKYYFEEEACLIIDAGSCITYDLVDKNNNYLGGSISPGISIRFKSLHSFTARLPLMSLTDYESLDNVDLTGKNTREAILSGVLKGIAAELNGIIGEYQATHPDIRILICGGDANYFESKIKQPIFAIPELVHWGLNRILEYNESEL